MLVLAATDELQGARDTDYHWATNDELVYIQYIHCHTPDCGCEFGFAGFESHRSTTTAMVVDRPDLTIESYAQQLAHSLHQGGWLDLPHPGQEMVAGIATDITEIARFFGECGPGEILEREHGVVRARTPAAMVKWAEKHLWGRAPGSSG